MTDVADRQWGQSLVRAPTAKAAADPDAPPPPPMAPPTLLRANGGPALAGASVPQPPAPLMPVARPPAPRPVPSPSPVSTIGPPIVPPLPDPPPAIARRSAPASTTATVLQWPVTSTPAAQSPTAPTPAAPTPAASAPAASAPAASAPVAARPVATPADPPADPSLARLARGVQDCARALASLADRLDGLERRIDAAAPASSPGDSARNRPGTPAGDDLDTRLRALEGQSTDRLHALDQRLRRLETLPAAVGRIQEDMGLLADLNRARRSEGVAPGAGAQADLAPIYEELDLVAELVASHQGTAAQSLERVRTLERAVLDMRRHLERNLADHTRAADARMATLEARFTAAGSSLRPTSP